MTTDKSYLLRKLGNLATSAALDAAALERKATSYAIERRESLFEEARADARWYRARAAHYQALADDLKRTHSEG